MTPAQDIARGFKLFASDARVRIVRLLRGRALCVGALSDRLGVTQGAVSQHLRVLRDAGLVVSEKRGYYVHYRLNERAVAKFRQVVDSLLETPERKGEKRCVTRRIAAVRNRKS